MYINMFHIKHRTCEIVTTRVFMCVCSFWSAICWSDFPGSTLSCLWSIFYVAARGSCENITSIAFLLHAQVLFLFLSSFDFPPPLWLQFLLFSSCYFILAQTLNFLQAFRPPISSLVPKTSQFTLLVKYLHGSLFHFLQVFAFHWGLFGHSVTLADWTP